MKMMKNYLNFYLKCDVLQFVDVCEEFRKSCLKNYTLCPSHYLSAPGLRWDAMLDMTEVELDLISDTDMYFHFEEGVRGGISGISKRQSR